MPTLADRLQRLVGTGFRIERELPLGGMSRLYVARDLAVERDVVVKVLPPDLACTASTARFRREVELTAQLLHPNIVPVLSAGGADDVLYYVTPFVPAESLRELVAREGALPLAAVRRVLDDVLDALAYAHSRGVVHRDVKPGNILLAAGGRAMLADFGIASALSAADQTGSDIVPGTPAYMAPEHPSDVQADLGATCVVAPEMLAGARPAPGVGAADIVKARARATGTREARQAEALAEALAAVVARGLAVEPSRRFADVEALRAAVAASAQRRIVTRRRLAGVAVVTVLALAGFAATRPSMEAARARQRGRVAEARFELDSAIAAYREALEHQADDSVSRLGLAQALVWRGEEADLVEATRELRSGAPRDSSMTGALLALAEQQYPEACRDFEHMTRRDSTDVQAWMGLAECRQRDDAIIPDPTSPSGYAFRSSYDEAATAYEHALDLTPRSRVLYLRLGKVLVSEANRLRLGRVAGGGTSESMTAYPELRGDTVVYVPRPAGHAHVPPSRVPAVERNLRRLFARYRDWTRISSESPDAHRAFSQVLEKSGIISATGEDDASALQAIRRARDLTPADSSLPLAVAELRLLVKSGEWAAAEALGDTLLRGVWSRDAAQADLLAGAAALAGRLDALTAHLRTVSATPKHRVRDDRGQEIELPDAIMATRAELMARATLGVCDARFHELRARLPALVRAIHPDPEAAVSTARLLLSKPAILMPECIDAAFFQEAQGPDPLVALHHAMMHGGPRAFRAAWDSLSRVRRHGRWSDIAPDYALGEAKLLLASGDSAAALERLDIALDALPGSSMHMLDQPAQAGAIGRMMLLAAELAHARGDALTARRWADALRVLWANADPPLRPAVNTARCIAETSTHCPRVVDSGRVTRKERSGNAQ